MWVKIATLAITCTVVLALLLALVYEKWWVAAGIGIAILLIVDYSAIRILGDGNRAEESQGRQG